ncbi:MAG: MBL fold metallo-hydrolase [Flavobacteriaceae bacterium]|nr:MBL fold metallo-hydrolase [Flavobacteriaceae bacterium]
MGTLQDGGSPHMGCEKLCCAVQKSQDYVSSIGVVGERQSFIFDATPDFVSQTNYLKEVSGHKSVAIFLTHAHMGHYTGLMHLGREAYNAVKTLVYAMPKMVHFLSKNGPWSQLVSLKNIALMPLQENQTVFLDQSLFVTPLKVPHRDEYSETVGYLIKGKNKTALYVPDIDKWSKWNRSIVALVKKVDYAFLDGTFFADGELPRPMSEVPHPFVSETAALLGSLPLKERQKVYFIHLNHSNPARNSAFKGRLDLERLGFQFAAFGLSFDL